jgi:hypothetical protein
MNRSKANPLPPFDKYQKERGAMQPASPWGMASVV